jgi:hypothetical protein
MGRSPLPGTDPPVLVNVAIGKYSEPRRFIVINGQRMNAG